MSARGGPDAIAWPRETIVTSSQRRSASSM
jgi:hypothetical protein